jgi:glyoxylase-like metal-dependent hydrolase (beta-lactamase superfamily II)
MKNTWWIAVSVGLCVAACTSRSPEQQIVDDAAEALGGRERILAAKTLVLEGEGLNGNLGQDMTPEATGQSFTLTGYRRTVDVAGRRMRIEQTRTPNFTYFQGQAPQKQVQGLDGDVGYNVAANGNATRVSNAVANDRAVDWHHHPITIIRAALDPTATLGNPRSSEGQRVVEVTTAGGLRFTLANDAATNLPTRVVSMIDNANLGDVAVETSFADYRDVGGLRLPGRITTRTDNVMTVDLQIAKQSVDVEVGDLAAPAAAASAAPTTGPPPAKVDVQEVAKGVWLLSGQSHHSVLVEFADHLKLIEAPQHDTRTLAVIARAREVQPKKPLTHVVVSHHHFDHSGGLRAAVSEGLTVMAHKASAAFVQAAAGRSHTIVPDALAKNPKPATVEAIDDGHVIRDAAMEVVLYHIQGSSHGDTLLMAYFPRERLLVEADVYSPGGAVAPYAANLLENIEKRKLRVDRIVPIHGSIGPFSDLVKTVKSAPATS